MPCIPFFHQEQIDDSFIWTAILANAVRVEKDFLTLALFANQHISVDIDRKLWIQFFDLVNVALPSWEVDSFHANIFAEFSVMLRSFRMTANGMQLCIDAIQNASIVHCLDIYSRSSFTKPWRRGNPTAALDWSVAGQCYVEIIHLLKKESRATFLLISNLLNETRHGWAHNFMHIIIA